MNGKIKQKPITEPSLQIVNRLNNSSKAWKSSQVKSSFPFHCTQVELVIKNLVQSIQLGSLQTTWSLPERLAVPVKLHAKRTRNNFLTTLKKTFYKNIISKYLIADDGQCCQEHFTGLKKRIFSFVISHRCYVTLRWSYVTLLLLANRIVIVFASSLVALLLLFKWIIFFATFTTISVELNLIRSNYDPSFQSPSYEHYECRKLRGYWRYLLVMWSILWWVLSKLSLWKRNHTACFSILR